MITFSYLLLNRIKKGFHVQGFMSTYVNKHTYKGPSVLVHGGSSTHGFTESLLDEWRWGEVREALSKVDRFVVRSQLSEFNPVDESGD